MLTITWLPGSPNESRFLVERMAQGEDDFTLIAETQRGYYGYDDTSLDPETWYTYRVMAENATGGSAYSDTAGALTPSLVLLNEDFENYNIGAPPGGTWGVTETGNGTSHVVAEGARCRTAVSPPQ